MIAQTIEKATVVETQAPEPVRVIRKVNGRHQFVWLADESEMTLEEKRERFCMMFGIYEMYG